MPTDALLRRRPRIPMARKRPFQSPLSNRASILTHSDTRSGQQCAPLGAAGKCKATRFSCFTKDDLQYIAEKWNANNRQQNTPIETKNSSDVALWKQIDARLKSQCNTEFCWIRQGFLQTARHHQPGTTSTARRGGKLAPSETPTNQNGSRRNNTTVSRTQTFIDRFRPRMPDRWYANPTEWLSTSDIRKVMLQYSAAYPSFLFIGPVPLDFAAPRDEKMGTCIAQALCNVNLSKWYASGIRTVGIVFNLDPHDQPGSHWTALYCNMKTGMIAYYDSFGAPPVITRPY